MCFCASFFSRATIYTFIYEELLPALIASLYSKGKDELKPSQDLCEASLNWRTQSV